MSNMTYKKAAGLIWEHMVIHKLQEDRAVFITQALELAIATLERLIPDPKTGLVPCGCGGIPRLFGSSGDDDSYCYECHDCEIDSPSCDIIEEAKFTWNRAMGWRENE